MGSPSPRGIPPIRTSSVKAHFIIPFLQVRQDQVNLSLCFSFQAHFRSISCLNRFLHQNQRVHLGLLKATGSLRIGNRRVCVELLFFVFPGVAHLTSQTHAD